MLAVTDNLGISIIESENRLDRESSSRFMKLALLVLTDKLGISIFESEREVSEIIESFVRFVIERFE